MLQERFLEPQQLLSFVQAFLVGSFLVASKNLVQALKPAHRTARLTERQAFPNAPVLVYGQPQPCNTQKHASCQSN